MDARTFFNKVVLMRKLQKDYWTTRTHTALRNCKAVEAEIDAEIERVNKIIGTTKQPEQKQLFND